MRMMVNRNFTAWIVLFILVGIITALLYLISVAGLSPDPHSARQLSWLGQVLMLIVGMATVAAFGLLHSLMWVSFRPANSPKQDKFRPQVLSPTQLVGVDNHLALSKLIVELNLQIGRLFELMDKSEKPKPSQEALLSALKHAEMQCEQLLWKREEGEEGKQEPDTAKTRRLVALGEWLLDLAEEKALKHPSDISKIASDLGDNPSLSQA